MEDLQSYIAKFGFGISVRELANLSYNAMAVAGHKVCMVNERYLEVDGVTYLFSKSRKYNSWIAKPIF